ncbi:MAG TPA: LLM class F420-dependent oxidoreductase [Dehalococcoidia bacterium]|nr:LLM class F420-dependent oxidoreductase [Dehalococcoidia bacterium]
MIRRGFTFPLQGLPLAAHREVLQEAERCGYTDAWTAEVDGNDAFVPLGAAATWTADIRLGTAIANVYTRGPALLAMEAATVSEAAPGRFCLGVGASSPAIVERWNGIEMKRPLRRMRETVAFLRGALAGEKVSSEALGVRGFRLSRAPSPPPPIFVAALRQKMLALAGETADGVIINWLAPSDVPGVVRVAREAAKAAGRDPKALEVACRIFVLYWTSEEVARYIARRALAAYLTTPVYRAFHQWLGRGDLMRPMLEAWDAGDRQAAVEAVPPQLVEDVFVIGGPQECRAKIEAYCRAGVTLPILNFVPISLDPQEQATQGLEMLKALGGS